ncbi:DUF7331 family protein [Halosimplex salinum]
MRLSRLPQPLTVACVDSRSSPTVPRGPTAATQVSSSVSGPTPVNDCKQEESFVELFPAVARDRRVVRSAGTGLVTLNKAQGVPTDSVEPTDSDGTQPLPMATHETRSETSRYDELEIANGDVVIYDVDNHRAWIQSDETVTGDEMA